MKRLLCMLLMVMMTFPAFGSAEMPVQGDVPAQSELFARGDMSVWDDVSVQATAEPEIKILQPLSPQEETDSMEAEEPCSKAESSYDEKCEYILSVFGFAADLCYPYFPTHLDPVAYNKYITLLAGFRDGQSYAAYGHYDEQDVQDYLGYLQYWGYEVAQQSPSLEGIREWVAVCPSPREDDKGLMESIRVYHSPEWEILAVSYPYLDGVLYRTWSESTIGASGLSFHETRLPYTTQVGEYAVTIEGMETLEELEIVSEHNPITGPYSDARFEEMMVISAEAEGRWKLCTVEDPRDRQRANMTGVHLSFDRAVNARALETLCIAVADTDEQYSHVADVPMLYACENNGALCALTDETYTSDLWVLFPPQYRERYTPRRVYLYGKDPDDPWIGDLRQWEYVDFYEAYRVEMEDGQETYSDEWFFWEWD